MFKSNQLILSYLIKRNQPILNSPQNELGQIIQAELSTIVYYKL
jgi:hypothetical protein